MLAQRILQLVVAADSLEDEDEDDLAPKDEDESAGERQCGDAADEKKCGDAVNEKNDQSLKVRWIRLDLDLDLDKGPCF